MKLFSVLIAGVAAAGSLNEFEDVRGAYCNGHPGGIKRSGYTLNSCSDACADDEKCTHFDWAPGKYNWCVLVTDGKACNTRNHGIWKHYEKKVLVLTQKFTKGANNGFWNVGKTNKGSGISLEKCAQACADEVTCDSFEVFQPSGAGHCWIFDKNTKSEWVSNQHANYYEMKAQYISAIDEFKDVRGAYCNGHPGGIKRSGYTLTSCSKACAADAQCTHFDWAPGKYNWCVLVTDGKACNTRNHGIWKHYEKKAEYLIAPIHCVGSFDAWTSWDVTCGAASRTRSFVHSINAEHKGNDCVYKSGYTETENQNIPCPIHCAGDFLEWDACTKTCASGSQTRTFDIATNAQYGGSICDHPHGHSQIQECNADVECPEPVDIELEVEETEESFTPAKQNNLRNKIAEQLGVDPSAVTISIGTKANKVTNSPYDRRLMSAGGLKITVTIQVLPSLVSDEVEKIESPEFAVATGCTFLAFKPAAGTSMCATCKWIMNAAGTQGKLEVMHFTNAQKTNEKGLQHKCYHEDGKCRCACNTWDSTFGVNHKGHERHAGPEYGSPGEGHGLFGDREEHDHDNVEDMFEGLLDQEN